MSHLPLNLELQHRLIVTSQQAKWNIHRHYDSSQVDHKWNRREEGRAQHLKKWHSLRTQHKPIKIKWCWSPNIFGHLMQRSNSLEKTLMPGKIEGRRKSGWQRMTWLDGITNSIDKSLSKLWSWWRTGAPGVLQSMGLQRVRHDRVTE